MQTDQQQRVFDGDLYQRLSSTESESLGYLRYEAESLSSSGIDTSVRSVLSESLTETEDHTPEFWKSFSVTFSEGLEPYHPITQSVLNDLYDEGVIRATMSTEDVLSVVHDRSQALIRSREVTIAAVLNYEASIVRAHQEQQGLTDAVIEVGSGISWTNQYEAGIVLRDASGVRLMKPGSTELCPFSETYYSSFTFDSDTYSKQSDTTGLNLVDFEAAHTYVDPANEAVLGLLTELFPNGYDDMSADDILVAIYNFMIDDNEFTYQRDIRDEWVSVESFIETRAGDCEDFANLQASLSIAALEAAGFEDAASRVEVRAGRLMGPYTTLGHAFMTYVNEDGVRLVLDSTDQQPIQSLTFPEGSTRHYDSMASRYQFDLALSYTATESVIHSEQIVSAGFQTANNSFGQLQGMINAGVATSIRAGLTMDQARVNALLSDTSYETSNMGDPPTPQGRTIQNMLDDVRTLNDFAINYNPDTGNTESAGAHAGSTTANAGGAAAGSFNAAEQNSFTVSQMGPLQARHLSLDSSRTLSGHDLSFMQAQTITADDGETRSAADYIAIALYSPVRSSGEKQRFEDPNDSFDGTRYSWRASRYYD